MIKAKESGDVNLVLCYKLLKLFERKMSRGVFVISHYNERANPICDSLFSILDIPLLKDQKADLSTTVKVGKFGDQTFVILPDCILKLNTEIKKIILYFLICSFDECRFLFVVTHQQLYKIGLNQIKQFLQKITAVFSGNLFSQSVAFIVSDPKQENQNKDYLSQAFGSYGFLNPTFHIKERKQETLEIIKIVNAKQRLVALRKQQKQDTRYAFEKIFDSMNWFKLNRQSLYKKIFNQKVAITNAWTSSVNNIMNNLLQSFTNRSQIYITRPQYFQFQHKIDGSTPKNMPIVNMFSLFISLVDIITFEKNQENKMLLKKKYIQIISLLKENQVISKDQILLTGYQELSQRLFCQGSQTYFIDFNQISTAIIYQFSCTQIFENKLCCLLSTVFETVEHYIATQKPLGLDTINILQRHVQTLESMIANPVYLLTTHVFFHEKTQKKIKKYKAQLDFLALKQQQSVTHFQNFFLHASKSVLVENDLIKSAYNLLASYLCQQEMLDEAILCYKKGHHESSILKIINIYEQGFQLNIRSLQLLSKDQFICNIHRFQEYAKELLFYGKTQILKNFIYFCLELCETFSLENQIKEKFDNMLFRITSQRNHNGIFSVLTKKFLDEKVQIEEDFLNKIYVELRKREKK